MEAHTFETKGFLIFSMFFLFICFNSPPLHWIRTEWIKDRNTVVCKFDFIHKEEVGACCMFPDYRKQVQKRVPFAAKIIKSVVAEMYMKVFDSFENFDMVGFSLGAHVAGYTAKLIKSQLGETVSRIFGNFYFHFVID